MSKGWISLHRKIQDNPLWKSEPFTKGQAWVDLLLLANHEPGFFYVRGNKINVDRGQVGWSQKRLSERWQWSRTKTRKFLQDLEKEQQIKQHKNTLSTLITIENYNKYQQEKQKKNSKKTSKEQQRNTNNNDNNKKQTKPPIPLTGHRYVELIAEELEQVSKLDKHLTVEQAEKLERKFGHELVEDVLMSMENYKGLTKKYTSAYLTVNNWCKKRIKDKPKEESLFDNHPLRKVELN